MNVVLMMNICRTITCFSNIPHGYCCINKDIPVHASITHLYSLSSKIPPTLALLAVCLKPTNHRAARHSK